MSLVKNKVMIQMSKLKKETKNKKQAKYEQKVITVLKIKQKHGLKQKPKANTKTTKTKM
jgi:hypothetical protein